MKFWTHFSQNADFIGGNIFYLVVVISFSWYLHLKLFHKVLTYHLVFGDESLKVLVLHIWNQLPKTLKDKFYFQTFQKVTKWLVWLFGKLILECYYVVDLVLDSIWLILVFCCKFSLGNISFLHYMFLCLLSKNK